VPDPKCLIEPLGRSVSVAPGQSLLDAALAAGLNIPHSCKSGHCTSCRAELVAGSVEYPRGRPAGLTAADEGRRRILMCQARIDADVVVQVSRLARRVAAELEILRLPCRIDAAERVAPDVLKLWLRLPADSALEFRAGQYLDVLLDDGRRRSFSIASPPHDASRLELHVRRTRRGEFTEALFEGDPIGRLLRIEAPLGQFLYEPSDAPLLLIAGGTGFAPIKSILRHALEQAGFRDAIRLYWGVRHPIDAYDEAWIDATCRAHPQLTYRRVVSDDATSGEWVHRRALADLAQARFERPDVYVAGPPQLVEAVRAEAPAQGIAADRIRFDSFDYAPA
jgi:CDP-4-dehydro-6-deoxyglucose reductase, E3